MDNSRINDVEKLEIIVSEYYEKIYKYCYWQFKNEYIAQDVTQEIFLSFIRHYSRGEIKNINAYIYKIAKNKCLDAWKQNRNDWDELTDQEDVYSDHIFESIVNRTVIEESISQLKRDEQEIVLLRYSQGLSIKEIAQIVGINPFKVQYRIKSALKKLKKMLQEDYTE